MSAHDTPLPWYADGRNFTCTLCGNCCSGPPGYVWVSPRETEAIASRMALPLAEFLERHTRRVGSRRSLLERSNGDCEFLERIGKGRTVCTIHPVRPLQCRTWPFWESNLASAETWERAACNCPGMNRGQHHALPIIQAALNANAVAGLPL